eukprot:scaffold159803_cov25-Prasinocladus_malaysianus.AAC.2
MEPAWQPGNPPLRTWASESPRWAACRLSQGRTTQMRPGYTETRQASTHCFGPWLSAGGRAGGDDGPGAERAAR